MSCTEGIPTQEIVDKLIDQGYFMSSNYNTPELLSQIKTYLLTFNLNPLPFREATDNFILFKNGFNAILVETIQGCGLNYMVMSPSVMNEFLTLFGTTL